jgi:uncharacterized protein YjbI with pentapeptide repeats
MAASLQGWVIVVGGLLTAALAIMQYFGQRSRRERASTVGSSFAAAIDGLSAQEPAKQLAAAVLLRRFFDPSTEQGAAGLPYQHEAISVIAALLVNKPSPELQKLLADGLAYAGSLAGADLQNCNLSRAYWGSRPRPAITNGAMRMLSGIHWRRNGARQSEEDLSRKCIILTDADLSYADLSRASLRDATAIRAVFRRCKAPDAVFEKANLRDANFTKADLAGADFRDCNLAGADFTGADVQRVRFMGAHLGGAQFTDAQLDGACFKDASGITDAMVGVLGPDGVSSGTP